MRLHGIINVTACLTSKTLGSVCVVRTIEFIGCKTSVKVNPLALEILVSTPDSTLLLATDSEICSCVIILISSQTFFLSSNRSQAFEQTHLQAISSDEYVICSPYYPSRK